MLRKIVSGGQTGADRAGLDAAIMYKLEHGGWCPKGRRALDGPLPAKYKLSEHPSGDYPPRTSMNVVESDGTLVVVDGPVTRGSALTIRICREVNKPVYVFDCSRPQPVLLLAKWARTNKITVLNVAGCAEEHKRGIYNKTFALLRLLISELTEGEDAAVIL